MKYGNLDSWLSYKRDLILDDYDDVNMVTGREGKGKSKWARKVARALDPSFSIDRVHFEWDSYVEQLAGLDRGQAIVLDEFRGHRRESMTKERMSVLDEFKENRGLGIHHFIVFNRFTKMDQDLVNDRVSDWSHVRRRGFVEVRQPHTELIFDKHGVPHEPTTYPHVASFTFTAWEPAGWDAEYRVKKDDRMRDRRARLREALGGEPEQASRLLDASLIEAIKGS